MPKRNFIDNSDLRFEIARKVFNKIGEKFTGKTYTDDEVKEVCNSEKNLKLYNEAKKLAERDAEQTRIVHRVLAKYGFSLPTNSARLCTYLMDVPKENATREEIEEIARRNEDTVLGLCNPKKMDEYLKKVTDTALNFDYSKLFIKDPEEQMKFYSEHSKEMNVLFIIDSVLGNSGYDVEPQVLKQLRNFKGLMEEAEFIRSTIYNSASNMPFIIPKDFDPSVVTADSFQREITSVLDEYKDVEGFKYSEVMKDSPEITSKEYYTFKGVEESHFKVGEILKEDLELLGANSTKDLILNYESKEGSYTSKIIDAQNYKMIINMINSAQDKDLPDYEKANYCAKLGIEYREDVTKEELKAKAEEIFKSISNKDLYNLKKTSPETKAVLEEKFKTPIIGKRLGNPVYRQGKEAHETMAEFMRKPDRYQKFFTKSNELANKDCTIEDAKDLITLYAYGKWKQESRGFFRKIFRRGACNREDEAVRNVESKLESLGFDADLRDAYKDVLASKNINYDKLGGITKEGPQFMTEKEFRQKEFFDAKNKVEEFEEKRRKIDIPELEIEDNKELDERNVSTETMVESKQEENSKDL